MSEHDAIRERLAAQRRARQDARRKRQRTVHGFVGAALLVGLLSVVPRYPGILVLLVPPLVVLIAVGLGYVMLRLPVLRATYARLSDSPPGFWAWLTTGGALIIGVAVVVLLAGGFGGTPIRQW